MANYNTIYNYFIPQPIKSAGKKFNRTGKRTVNNNGVSIRSGNNTPIYGLPSIWDSLLRGIGRYYETKIDDYFLRIGFRFLTENIRYVTSRGLLNLFQKQKIGLDLLTIGFKKSLEISLGTAIVDPNREPERLKRMGSGFFNMVARLGSRVGLVGLNILDKKQFSYKILADEFLSRTLCRALYIDSENPFWGIGCRTVEQFAINEWVRNLPIYKFVLSNMSFEQASKNHRSKGRKAAA